MNVFLETMEEAENKSKKAYCVGSFGSESLVTTSYSLTIRVIHVIITVNRFWLD